MIVDAGSLAGRREIRADVVVVGTGAGGAPAAKELAEAGATVVMLEEGAHHPTDTLTARPRESLAMLYRDGGQIATVGAPPIVLPLGRAVGGTTLVNSGTGFRTPPNVLERWRRELGLQLDLEPCFERVEAELNVVEVPPELAGRNAAASACAASSSSVDAPWASKAGRPPAGACGCAPAG